MKTLDQKKLELLNIYIDNNPSNVKIKEVRELLGNPFYIFDVSLRLLYASNYDDINKKFLKKADNHYFIEPELFNQILTDDDFKELENDEILIKKYNNIKERFMIQRISDGKYTIGYVCIYLTDESQIDDDKELLKLGIKALSHEFEIQGFSNNIDQAVFSRILDGSLTSKGEMDLALDKIGFSIHDNIRLMVIKTNNVQKTGYFINDIDNTIRFFNYKGDILCFVDRNREKVNTFLNNLTNILMENDSKVGISGLFNDISELSMVYEQAIEAIEIGTMYFPDKMIHYYGDYRIISIFKSQKRENLEKSIDRRLKRVIKYDSENGTTYFNDLKAYFDSGRNINKTAELLFVHKNSIYYRLERIKTLFDIDIEDENGLFMIELSIKILNLLDKFNHD